MDAILRAISNVDNTTVSVYQAFVRYAAPLLMFVILLRCVKSLLLYRREPEIWAWLISRSGKKIALTHWENVIGRSRRSDVVIDIPTVSRNHAVLTRYDDGSWSISDAGSKAGFLVNGQKVSFHALEEEDVIDICGFELTLVPISRKQEKRLQQVRTKPANPLTSINNLLLLTVFQMIVCFSYLMNLDPAVLQSVFIGFAGIMISQWLLLLFYVFIRKPSFDVELIAFLLCTMGMAAIASVRPSESVKQLYAIIMGLVLYLAIGWSVRDLERTKKFRYAAGVVGVLLLLITLIFGKEFNGAKNWLMIGPLSIQPSELSKVCFVYVGASTMDRIMNKRNIILFIAYTLTICACLAVMNDFGTALIFFAAFLLIAYLRSGSVGTIALACTALGFAGVMALRLIPHAMKRFTNWRHIWDDPFGAGYQQTRALMCIASGGLLGMGAGNGMMYKIFAADSDMVFATLAEEWGLIICLMLIVFIIVLGLFTLRNSAIARSSFFTIGACTASGILIVQTIFNALGTVDILPLTGVTFPFVSNGGSSMLCAWGLLAFIKASDTRQNASFAVRQSREGRQTDE